MKATKFIYTKLSHLVRNSQFAILFILVMQGIGIKGYGQGQFQCGFDVILNDAIQNQGLDLNQFNLPQVTTNSLSGIYTVPVVFHLIGNDANLLTDADILNQLNILNDDFAAINFSPISSSTDAQIRFCLAQNTPNNNQNSWTSYGATTPGITRFNSATANAMQDVSIPPGTCPPAVHHSLLNSIVHFEPDHYLNIYIVRTITNCFITPGGFAFFPNEPAGIVIIASAVPSNSNPGFEHLLTHEVGHTFGLFHPFQNGCAGMSSLDCLTSGDRCCDTPPVNGPISGCPVGANTCSEGYIIPTGNNDMIENYMDYSDDNCKNTFTLNQCERMQYLLNIYRHSLVEQANLIYTGVVNSPGGCIVNYFNSEFNSFKAGSNTITGMICLGDAFEFKAFSDPTYTYNWNFAGGTPTNLTGTIGTNANNPIVNYSATGVYDVSLTVTNGTQTMTTSKQVVVTICSPIISTRNNWHFGVKSSINFNTGIGTYQQPSEMNGGNMSSASISDINSNLLFYTNGNSIWYSNAGTHLKIPGGNNTLNGNPGNNSGLDQGTTTQSVVICPRPLVPNAYFIYTNSNVPQTGSGTQNGITQYEVSTNSSVPVLLNNTLSPFNPCENYVIEAPLAIVPHCNGFEYWLICKGVSNNLTNQGLCSSNITNPEEYFFSYLISATGISNTPVRSWANFSTPIRKSRYSPTSMSFSPDKKYFCYGNGGALLYFFDCETGMLNYTKYLTDLNGGHISFSPNSRFMYGVNNNDGSGRQYDLEHLSMCETNLEFKEFEAGFVDATDGAQSRLGPDNRIYLNGINSVAPSYISVINFPDLLLTSNLNNEIGFTPYGIKIVAPPSYKELSLPNDIIGQIGATQNDFRIENCNCGLVSFVPYSCGTNFTWDFGDGTSVISGVNSEIPMCTHNGITYGNYEYPLHIYQNTGTYTVSLIVDGNLPITKIVNITNAPPVMPNILTPTLNFCNGSSLNNIAFNTNTPLGNAYNWQSTNSSPTSGYGINYSTSFTNLPACVKLTYKTANGCVNSNVVELNYTQLIATTSALPSVICAGSITNLSVTTNCVPVNLNYSWIGSNGFTSTLQNPQDAPISTTTYTVTVTDVNVSTATSIITVVVNPLPIVSVNASPMTLCPGNQSTTLTALGASTYTWQPGAQNGNPIVAIQNVTTTYTVTGRDANNCQNTATVLVTTGLPSFTLSASNNCVGGSVPNVTIIPSTNIYTYTIQPGGSFTVTTSNIYTVTATSAGGCTSSQTIYIADCGSCPQAPANALWYNNPTSSTVFPSTIMPSTPVVINGTLTINNNLQLIGNPNVYFTPNSQAILANGTTFTIDNSTLQGCAQMWTGIKADNPSESIVINNSQIRDMNWGVDASFGANINVQKSEFIDNAFGVRIFQAPSGFNLANGNCVIRNNKFTSSGNNLLPPMQNFNKGDVGILLQACEEAEIGKLDISDPGEKNSFENLYTGIWSIPAAKTVSQDIKIYNNDFSNIQDDPFTGTYPTYKIITNCYLTRKGAGIYFDVTDIIGNGPPSYIHNLLVKHVPDGGQFSECDKAVVGFNVNATVMNTLVKNTYMGFMFTGAKHLYKIGDEMSAPGLPKYDGQNVLSGVFIGTQLIGNLEANSFVNYNEMGLYDGGILNGPNAAFDWPVGIDIRETANPSEVLTVMNNIITIPNWSGTGIRLLKTGANLNAFLNELNFTTGNASTYSGLGQKPELKGIELIGSVSGILKGNQINGIQDLNAYNARNATGIKINRSTNLTFECNHINNTRYGFWTIDNCNSFSSQTSGVLRNDFDNHRHAMFFTFAANEGSLGNIGIIGLDNSNSFANTNISKPYSGDYRLYRIAMNSNSPNIIYSNSLSQIQSESNITTSKYQVQSGNSASLSNCSPPFNIQPIEGGGEIDMKFALDVIQDSLLSMSFPEMGEYLLQKELYRSLDEDSISRVENNLLNDFYIQERDSVLGKLHAIDNEIKNLEAESDPILLTQQIQLANTLNGNIATARLFEQNEKQINTIYFDYLLLGWNGLTLVQKQYVETLAKSCIYTHGLGVDKARMLWANAEPGLEYDDLYICTEGTNKTDLFATIKEELNKGTEGQEDQPIFTLLSDNNIIFYPNPVKNIATIRHSFKGAVELRIEIYDNAGRKVKVIMCKDCNTQTSIDLSGFSNGLYSYKVIQNNRFVKVGKFDIIK